jgi:energy-coupling factor transporter ATP-binding protein EcfA2
MLERIHIQGFKSLRDVEVELAPLVVVFGPNAAGKSNFLEALMLLARLVREPSLAEAFGSGIRGYPLEAFSIPEGGIEAFYRSYQEEHGVGLDLIADVRLGEERVRYRIEPFIDAPSGDLVITGERLERISEGGQRVGDALIDRPRLANIFDEVRFVPEVEPEQWASRTLASADVAGPLAQALRAELSAWRLVHLDPRDTMRRPQPPRDTDGIGERGELLVPFLHRLAHKHPKAFAAVLRGVQAIIPSVEAIITELVPSRGEIDLKVKQDGTWYSARVLSEGTLRVMAVCAMAAAPNATGLLAFEEPENGVHPRRIEVITSILAHAARKRQVILTTHSPLVVGQVCRLLREGELAPEQVRLLRCSSGPEGTKLRPFDPFPVLDDAEIRATLADKEDSDIIQAMLVRGWLD